MAEVVAPVVVAAAPVVVVAQAEEPAAGTSVAAAVYPAVAVVYLEAEVAHLVVVAAAVVLRNPVDYLRSSYLLHGNHHTKQLVHSDHLVYLVRFLHCDKIHRHQMHLNVILKYSSMVLAVRHGRHHNH